MYTLKEATLYKNHGKTVGDWVISMLVEPSGNAELLIRYSKKVGGEYIAKTVPVSGKNISGTK